MVDWQSFLSVMAVVLAAAYLVRTQFGQRSCTGCRHGCDSRSGRDELVSLTLPSSSTDAASRDTLP